MAISFLSIEPLPTSGAVVEQRENQYHAFVDEFYGFIYKKCLLAFETRLSAMSREDLWEKFLCGRVKYGGEFAPEMIRSEIESTEEIRDFFHYVAFPEFLIYEDDPDSFREYASQYMQ